MNLAEIQFEMANLGYIHQETVQARMGKWSEEFKKGTMVVIALFEDDELKYMAWASPGMSHDPCEPAWALETLYLLHDINDRSGRSEYWKYQQTGRTEEEITAYYERRAND